MLQMTTKAVNYTPEQTATIVTGYKSGQTVEQIAESMGKSVRSIVAKLSREGVYEKKAYKTKTGQAVVKKDELSDRLQMLVGLTEAEADSLTKANKTALTKIIAAIEAK
jgi:hypothetical protein